MDDVTTILDDYSLVTPQPPGCQRCGEVTCLLLHAGAYSPETWGLRFISAHLYRDRPRLTLRCIAWFIVALLRPLPQIHLTTIDRL